MVDLKLLVDKYKTKVGYTLTAISLALFAITTARPKIDDPDASVEVRQLYGAGLIFLMVLLFGILKNFVWDDSWRDSAADAAPPAAGAMTEAKEPAAVKEESGKTRKRTPKL